MDSVGLFSLAFFSLTDWVVDVDKVVWLTAVNLKAQRSFHLTQATFSKPHTLFYHISKLRNRFAHLFSFCWLDNRTWNPKMEQYMEVQNCVHCAWKTQQKDIKTITFEPKVMHNKMGFIFGFQNTHMRQNT